MIRYYLIPFETDTAKMLFLAQPKYLSILGTNSGLIPEITNYLNGRPVAFRRNYYIIKMDRPTAADFAAIDAMPDVREITSNIGLNVLSAIGIDTTGLTAQSTFEEKQVRIVRWMLNRDLTFAEVLP